MVQIGKKEWGGQLIVREDIDEIIMELSLRVLGVLVGGRRQLAVILTRNVSRAVLEVNFIGWGGDNGWDLVPTLLRHDDIGIVWEPGIAQAFRMKAIVRADLKSNHLVTKRCPLLPWNSGVAAGVLVGPN